MQRFVNSPQRSSYVLLFNTTIRNVTATQKNGKRVIYHDIFRSIFTLLDFTRVSWGYISVAHGPTSDTGDPLGSGGRTSGACAGAQLVWGPNSIARNGGFAHVNSMVILCFMNVYDVASMVSFSLDVDGL